MFENSIIEAAEKNAAGILKKIDGIALLNQKKVLEIGRAHV